MMGTVVRILSDEYIKRRAAVPASLDDTEEARKSISAVVCDIHSLLVAQRSLLDKYKSRAVSTRIPSLNLNLKFELIFITSSKYYTVYYR